MPMTFLTMLMYLGTALAELLYKAAMIPPHARILDIGHGCGDSWRDERASTCTSRSRTARP